MKEFSKKSLAMLFAMFMLGACSVTDEAPLIDTGVNDAISDAIKASGFSVSGMTKWQSVKTNSISATATNLTVESLYIGSSAYVDLSVTVNTSVEEDPVREDVNGDKIVIGYKTEVTAQYISSGDIKVQDSSFIYGTRISPLSGTRPEGYTYYDLRQNYSKSWSSLYDWAETVDTTWNKTTSPNYDTRTPLQRLVKISGNAMTVLAPTSITYDPYDKEIDGDKTGNYVLVNSSITATQTTEYTK